MKNLKNITKEIDKKGFYIFKNFYSKKKTSFFKKKLISIFKKRKLKNEFTGDNNNQILWNYFSDDRDLLEILYQFKFDRILSELIDKDYVLQSSVAQNRTTSINKEFKNKFQRKLGSTWHTDTRYIAKKSIKDLSYLIVTALDDFVKNKGATYFIENSFKFKKHPPRRIKKEMFKKKLKLKHLVMNEGDVCIMKTSMWHKAGKSLEKQRWSIFSIYTPWFMKPYYNYLSLNKYKIEKKYKKLLHFNSIPPEIGEHRNILTKI